MPNIIFVFVLWCVGNLAYYYFNIADPKQWAEIEECSVFFDTNSIEWIKVCVDPNELYNRAENYNNALWESAKERIGIAVACVGLLAAIIAIAKG
ncbi:hypothetical protein [Photobacterium sp. GSS17]|uniref:hypothetical protein n=1 Tax=Photobacterium sp. GSS17 TaxID=3020715 RepID=UPI002362802B|nr:hypothetical protein [Photobacterium sp. GSS17]